MNILNGGDRVRRVGKVCVCVCIVREDIMNACKASFFSPSPAYFFRSGFDKFVWSIREKNFCTHPHIKSCLHFQHSVSS